MSTKAKREINHKLRVFTHAEEYRNVAFTCRYFGISRDTFYRWRRNFRLQGKAGLVNSKPCPENPKLRTPEPIVEKILYLRRNYHFAQQQLKDFNIVAKFSFRIHTIQTDNGHEFQSKFHWHLNDLGINYERLRDKLR